jgi:ABC-type bacteriocin/lantibiotic exporter with double-glycine peptidase domain
MDAPLISWAAGRARSLAAAIAHQPAIPHVQQARWADSGAACLAMVLAHHGKRVALDELSGEMATARDGVGAGTILEAAARRGLTGRKVQVDVADLALLPRASILHWVLGAFVVFDGVDPGGGVRIVDPELGRRVVAPQELGVSFNGLALVLEPGSAFESRARTGRGGGLGRLFSELRAERTVFARVLVASLLLRVFALAVPLLTALVVDQVVPRADRNLLLIAALGVGFLVAFDALGSILRSHLLLYLRTRVDTRMTLGFVDHLINLPYSFFQTRSTGDLVQRVGCTATLREVVTSGSLAGLLDGCFVGLYAAVILFISPRLGILVLVLASLHVAVYLVSRRRYRQLMVQDLEAQASAQSHLVQMLTGIESLKCAGAENQSLGKWLNLYTAQLNVALERDSLSAGVDTVRRALETLAPIGILTIGAIAVTGGELGLGSMLAICALAGGLFGPLSALMASLLQLQLVSGYLERVDDVLDTPREQAQPGAPAHPLEGAIAVRDLSFRYQEGGPLAVAGVSLDIPRGGSVAIVGPTGSGKSTLASLLVGLYRPSEGEVYYDGHALSGLDLASVRRQIGVVPQNPYVFGASVRENIALCAPDSDGVQIEWAARAACIHETIEEMPMGYHTVIADGGASLSSGQRQRIAIARAVLSGPPILMLDEATTALDPMTENRVMNNLDRLGATRIVVAHRLATIVDADLIVVMDQGRVVESGCHGDLLALGGLYAALIGSRRGELPPLEVAS